MSSSSSTVTSRHNVPSSTSSTIGPNTIYPSHPLTSSKLPPIQPHPENRIPVTPAVLRSIFASSRTPLEERSISRVAFFRFAGFLLSCLGISLAAARGRSFKSAAGLGLV